MNISVDNFRRAIARRLNGNNLPEASRNFYINVLEGILQVAAATFVNINTVVPTLINRLGGSNFLVGLTPGFATFILQMPQVLVARYIERLPLKKGFVFYSRLVYTISLLTGGLAISLLTGINPAAGLVVFLISLFTGWFAWGLGDPAWVDLMAKINPSGKVGEFFAIRFFMGNIAGILAGYLMVLVLSLEMFPHNYALVYIISFLLAAPANYIFTLTQEEKGPVSETTESLTSYLRRIPSTLRQDPNFCFFLGTHVTYILATMSIPLFVVYGLKRFALPQSFTGVATTLIILGQMTGALLFRFTGKKFGHRPGLAIGIGSIFTANMISLASPIPSIYYLVFVLVGLAISSNAVSKFAFVVQLAPLNQRPSYVAYMNACGAPFVLIAPALGGFLADEFGYSASFLTAILFATISLYLLLFKVQRRREGDSITSDGDGRAGENL